MSRHFWIYALLTITILLLVGGFVLLRSTLSSLLSGCVEQQYGSYDQAPQRIERTHAPVRYWMLILVQGVLSLGFIGGGLALLALLSPLVM